MKIKYKGCLEFSVIKSHKMQALSPKQAPAQRPPGQGRKLENFVSRLNWGLYFWLKTIRTIWEHCYEPPPPPKKSE